MPTSVWITTRFEGYHRWKDASDSVSFLRDYHRHIFHVKLYVSVNHNNRDIEFITLKKEVEKYLRSRYDSIKGFDDSCETIASDLLERFDASSVEVSEDGENGALITRDITEENISRHLQQEKALGTATDGNNSIVSTVKTKCFLGIEAEGPTREKALLFIPGSLGPDIIQVYEKVKGSVFGVYYGAGNDRNIRLDTLAALRKVVEDRYITLEVNRIDSSIPLLPKGITVSLDPEDLYRATYIKVFANNKVHWISKQGEIYSTSLDDPLFAQDEDIE